MLAAILENRAHRVGQTREVEVVRLVTRNTIEEQIHALGETKLALDDRVAGVVTEDTGDKKASLIASAKAEKQGVQMVEEMMIGKLKEELNADNGAVSLDTNDSIQEMLGV